MEIRTFWLVIGPGSPFRHVRLSGWQLRFSVTSHGLAAASQRSPSWPAHTRQQGQSERGTLTHPWLPGSMGAQGVSEKEQSQTPEARCGLEATDTASCSGHRSASSSSGNRSGVMAFIVVDGQFSGKIFRTANLPDGRVFRRTARILPRSSPKGQSLVAGSSPVAGAATAAFPGRGRTPVRLNRIDCDDGLLMETAHGD